MVGYVVCSTGYSDISWYLIGEDTIKVRSSRRRRGLRAWRGKKTFKRSGYTFCGVWSHIIVERGVCFEGRVRFKKDFDKDKIVNIFGFMEKKSD